MIAKLERFSVGFFGLGSPIGLIINAFSDS